MHVHDAVVAHHATGRLALDLHPDDIFWCTADPGWVTGTSYGIIAPLTHGVTSIVDEADFDAERWYALLEQRARHVWYTAPTAIRMLMKAGAELARKHDLSALRFVASVGEPLNPEARRLGQRGARPADPRQLVADRDRRDHDRQLRGAATIRPGSMGRPLPGIEAAIVRAHERAARSRWSTSPASRASSRCAPAGRRCSAAT